MPITVVLVDEEPLVANATARLLRPRFEVRVAVGIAGALAEVARRPPTVLVADLHIAGMESLALMEKVAASHPAVRRILVSWWPLDDAKLVPPGLVESLLRKGDLAALVAVIEKNS